MWVSNIKLFVYFVLDYHKIPLRGAYAENLRGYRATYSECIIHTFIDFLCPNCSVSEMTHMMLYGNIYFQKLIWGLIPLDPSKVTLSMPPPLGVLHIKTSQ